MKLFDGLESLHEPITSSTVAIGTFDGIHVGHQAIIRESVEDAKAHDRRAVVFTFDRHPAELLAPHRAPEYLATPEQRNQLVASLGVDDLVVAAFDRTLAGLSPDEFVEQILRDRLGAKTVVVGENFAFGRNRSGNVAYLEAAQRRYGYKLRPLQPVVVAGAPASSTRVRELLKSGDTFTAEQVLGHEYWLAGKVVEGQKLGRQLGYPTANLERSCRQVVPLDGIYAVWVRLPDGRIVKGACSIGDRPTIEGAGRSIETYLLDFNEDLYGKPIELRFVKRLRGEEKFASLDELKAQMAKDVEAARIVLGSG
jgi:riboflavin kinase/FMN adenylyltransferase